MDFIDSTLIRLADGTTRAGVFDETVLEHMSKAAYDAAALSITGPYTAVFDKLTIGLSVAPVSVIEGVIRDHTGAPTADLQIQAGGLGPLLPARVDALWSGSIVARILPTESHITSVNSRVSVGDVDAAIITDLGVLPPDAGALETERRTRVISQMKAAMADPALLTDDSFDAWLKEIGASSVSELVANGGTTTPGVMQIGFAAPTPGQAPTPKALPIVAAILIRDAGFSVAQLLMESKMVREQLAEQGLAVPASSSLPALNPLLVVWVVPVTVFDDQGWPGTGPNAAALRASRRQNASAWLGAEGIAIAGVDV